MVSEQSFGSKTQRASDDLKCDYCDYDFSFFKQVCGFFAGVIFLVDGIIHFKLW